MQQRQIVLHLLFPPNEQPTKAVHPGVSSLHDPARARTQVSLSWLGLLPLVADYGQCNPIPPVLHILHRSHSPLSRHICCGCSSVGSGRSAMIASVAIPENDHGQYWKHPNFVVASSTGTQCEGDTKWHPLPGDWVYVAVHLWAWAAQLGAVAQSGSRAHPKPARPHFQSIGSWVNTSLHSSLGYLSPVEFENQWLAQQGALEVIH